MPLDEASIAVFVIVSGSDGRADGRKRFWSQLNSSKTVRVRPYMSMGANRNPWACYRIGPSPTADVPPKSTLTYSNRVVERSPIDVPEFFSLSFNANPLIFFRAFADDIATRFNIVPPGTVWL